MPCPRCLADPTPSRLTQPRRCAFDESGAFLPAVNWNCATFAFLLGHPLAQDFQGMDESIQFVPAMTAVVDEQGNPSATEITQDGFLVMTRHGRSGSVESLIHVGVFPDPAAVTLQMVEECIEALRKQAQQSTGLVTVQ